MTQNGNGTGLAKVESAALAPGLDMVQSLGDVFQLARALKGAVGFIPKALDTEGKIAACILAGREMGIPPMQSLRGIHIIDGKPTFDATLIMARIMERIPGIRVEWIRSDAEVAELRLQRPGHAPYTQRFTIEEAKSAGLTGKDNWRKYPAAMLRARCISAAARAYTPDVFGGAVYAHGEIGGEEEQPAEIAVQVETRPAPAASKPARSLDDIAARATPRAVATTADGTKIDAGTGEVIEAVVEETIAPIVDPDWIIPAGKGKGKAMRDVSAAYLTGARDACERSLRDGSAKNPRKMRELIARYEGELQRRLAEEAANLQRQLAEPGANDAPDPSDVEGANPDGVDDAFAEAFTADAGDR